MDAEIWSRLAAITSELVDLLIHCFSILHGTAGLHGESEMALWDGTSFSFHLAGRQAGTLSPKRRTMDCWVRKRWRLSERPALPDRAGSRPPPSPPLVLASPSDSPFGSECVPVRENVRFALASEVKTSLARNVTSLCR